MRPVPADITTNERSRKLIRQMGISLDGFVAVPSGHGLTPVMEGGSGLAPEDHELTRTKVARAWKAGAHLMGRVTYEEMASYWPDARRVPAAPRGVQRARRLRQGVPSDDPILRLDRGAGRGAPRSAVEDIGSESIRIRGARRRDGTIGRPKNGKEREVAFLISAGQARHR
jgi:hypothetical protein